MGGVALGGGIGGGGVFWGFFGQHVLTVGHSTKIPHLCTAYSRITGCHYESVRCPPVIPADSWEPAAPTKRLSGTKRHLITSHLLEARGKSVPISSFAVSPWTQSPAPPVLPHPLSFPGGGGGVNPKFFVAAHCVVGHCHLYPLYSWQDILLTLAEMELDTTTMFPPGTNVIFIRSMGEPVLA